MRYATDKIWEYKVGNLQNWRIDGEMKEILWYTGDEEEERPAMKQKHWARSGSASERNKGYIGEDL